jgi:hypothetical protein
MGLAINNASMRGGRHGKKAPGLEKPQRYMQRRGK